jgi:hypothetical protein
MQDFRGWPPRTKTYWTTLQAKALQSSFILPPLSLFPLLLVQIYVSLKVHQLMLQSICSKSGLWQTAVQSVCHLYQHQSIWMYRPVALPFTDCRWRHLVSSWLGHFAKLPGSLHAPLYRTVGARTCVDKFLSHRSLFLVGRFPPCHRPFSKLPVSRTRSTW